MRSLFNEPHLLIYLLAENYGDPSGKLWSMYLTEAAKEDDEMTKNWTKDTQGVLTFVSSKNLVLYFYHV